MTEDVDKEELYWRLAQARRIFAASFDQLTKHRIGELISDLEKQLAVVEAIDPEDQPE